VNFKRPVLAPDVFFIENACTLFLNFKVLYCRTNDDCILLMDFKWLISAIILFMRMSPVTTV
jgi:hypothetical protein